MSTASVLHKGWEQLWPSNIRHRRSTPLRRRRRAGMVRRLQADLETSMRLLFVSACLAVLAAAAPAQAQECDRNDDSQQMMNICAGEDYQAADAKLNQAYKDLVGRNDDKSRKLLQVAQRAWIAFRDAECAYNTTDSEGGSIHPMEVSQCLTELTDQRIKQLTSGTNCQEGDASCASPDEEEDLNNELQ
ncbi:lysozyme inhibitor LprI family protein [Mesorhizobium sp. 128a]